MEDPAAVTELDLIRPYVPRLLVRHLAEAPTEPVRTVEGSMLFVDVSGFTNLSERLARTGKEGAEELADTIGSCFTALLALAYEDGGGLIKFGGDALLLFFDGEHHVERACRSAVRMRRCLREIGRLQTSGGKVTLRMSSGVHSGTFHFFVVGGSHRELIVAGPAVSRTVEMEATAGPGEIVVSPDTAAALAPRLVGGGKGTGWLLRREPSGRPLAPPEPDLRVGLEAVLGCVPVAIREHLLSGVRVPEHRRATVAFLHFEGTDALIEREGPARAAAALDGLVRTVQDAVEEREVCFLGSDVDRDGGKLILVAGAPRALGDDEERMLHAIRSVVDVGQALAVRLGVHRGEVFAGDIGPAYRRTYTVMGDAVNLAARLMARAGEGEVVVSPPVLERSRTRFAVAELEPFFVKGKAKAQRAFTLGEPIGAGARTPASDLPLVGREHEMALLREALDAARTGRGEVLILTGESGVGKSRLLEELAKDADDVRRFALSCELYAESTPYHPVRGLLREILGIEERARPAAAGDVLRVAVAERAPALLPWLPLLAVPLDAEVVSTPEVDALDERFRRTRVEEAVVGLLAALLPDPVLLIFEDAQWMDEASAALVGRLAEQAGSHPWLVAISTRSLSPVAVAAESSTSVTIAIPPLDLEEALALVTAATEGAPLPSHQTEIITQRAGGNPLFLLEMAAAVGEAGSIGGLTESVGSVITARIDRLAPRDRDLLRRASVLGSTFDRGLLASVVEGAVPTFGDPVWVRLRDFLQVEEEGSLAFTQKLVRDVAYDGLPYRLRRDLHARVGETIEREADEGAEHEAELLSLHFILARRFDEAWLYARLAGERALAKSAPSEAARFFRRALEAARSLDGVSVSDVAAVFESLGDAGDRTGDFAAADGAYAEARRLLAGDPIAEGRLWLKQAWIPERAGRYPLAIRRIGRARALVEPIDTPEAASLGAQLAAWQAAVRQAQGRSLDAVRWCRRAIGEAEASGNRDALAHAYFILDWALFDLDRADEAGFSEHALRIYEELGDVGRQAVVLNNLGGMAYWEGDWDAAVTLYERGRQARLRTGDPVNAASGTFNVGEIRSDQGRLDEADSLFRETLRVWRAAAYRPGIALAVSYLGRVASRAGRFDEARQLLGEARAVLEEIGAENEILQADAFAAECDIFGGRWQDALRVTESALARAETTEGGGSHAPLLHRVRGYAQAQRGNLEAARTELEESLRSARARNAAYEVALTLEALEHLAEREGAAHDVTLARERRLIFARLGVRETFPVRLGRR